MRKTGRAGTCASDWHSGSSGEPGEAARTPGNTPFRQIPDKRGDRGWRAGLRPEKYPEESPGSHARPSRSVAQTGSPGAVKGVEGAWRNQGCRAPQDRPKLLPYSSGIRNQPRDGHRWMWFRLIGRLHGANGTGSNAATRSHSRRKLDVSPGVDAEAVRRLSASHDPRVTETW